MCINAKFKSMTYKEFYEWCNDRLQDGHWNTTTELTCLRIIDCIDSIKIKGLLFRKKRLMAAKETAWKNIWN